MRKLVVVLLAGLGTDAARAAEPVVRLSSPVSHSDWMLAKNPPSWGIEGVRQILDRAKECGWSRVYWRAFDGGRATYPSKVMTPFRKWDEDNYHVGKDTAWVIPIGNKYDFGSFDSLKEAINYGRKIGVEVHVWLSINEDDHGWGLASDFSKKNPDKTWVRRDGTAFRSQMSFAFPEVREYKLNLVREIAAYKPDGLFFDWIRTGDVRDNPQTEANGVVKYGYEKPNLDAFRKQYGVDAKTVANDDLRWVAVRAEPQTVFMRDAREIIRKANPKMPVSAMVQHPHGYRGGTPQTTYKDNLSGLLCDVATWAKDGLVDEFVYAGYYRADGSSEAAHAALVKETGGKVPVWTFGWIGKPEAFATDVGLAKKLKAPELLLWESDYIGLPPANSATVQAMKEHATSSKAAPEAPSKKMPVRLELRVGVAGHAFEHLGAINDQAATAVASGMTVIYPGCFGQAGADGLPAPDVLKADGDKYREYIRKAKADGVKLSLAYVCSTSIVKLETFDKNWSKEFRSQFATPPSQWLQQDRDGKPLPSWYGGSYLPACKNNPDWRLYSKAMVKRQLDLGNDGIFFDNPTVHPQGCYCEHCMKKFAGHLTAAGTKLDLPAVNPTAYLRVIAAKQPAEFMKFRCTIARDYLAEMRTYARTIKPDALITCNNSLNTPDAFFSQCRTMGYNIYEMSKAQDLVVVEDMATQPRVMADGRVAEYGPTYELLHSICHGKPLVACKLADGDYHTAPNLVRLAMAEAAAHGASYLAWPTWPEAERARMIAQIRPQADLLRTNAGLLNDTMPQTDALVFLPFRRWVETAVCQPRTVVAALSRANIQYSVVCEDDFAERLKGKPSFVLLAESAAVLTAAEQATVDGFQQRGGKVIWTNAETWLADYRKVAEKPTVTLDGPATLRAVVRDLPSKRIVHLLNLNVQRLSSFADKVTPAADVKLRIRVPFRAKSVTAISADSTATAGPVAFKMAPYESDILEIAIPKVMISTMLLIEQGEIGSEPK